MVKLHPEGVVDEGELDGRGASSSVLVSIVQRTSTSTPPETGVLAVLFVERLCPLLPEARPVQHLRARL
ncbi:hypothetical protein [Sanguibacter sp. 25GB23B1]|uniref:hypothetical protein n=1 Tax=unclassified Sanguibacter TaxID=2645534 RepID=UPI0032AF49E2